MPKDSLPDKSGNNDAKSSIAFEMKRIAYNSLLVLNDRDFAHQSTLGQEVLACISDSYEARLDNYPDTMTWWQLNDVWAQWAADDERLKFVMQNVSAYVEEEAGEASVYMDMDIEGLGGVLLKGFSELKWRREDGSRSGAIWKIYQFHGMRGMRGEGLM